MLYQFVILDSYHRVVEVFDHWDFVWIVSLPDVLGHCVGPVIKSQDVLTLEDGTNMLS